MNILDQLIDLAEKQAHMVLLDLKQDLMPSWVLVSNGKGIEIIGTPWRDDREKHVTKARMKRQIREGKVVAYSFVTEAWQAEAPAGWDPDSGEPLPVRPKDNPNRIEVVIAMATNGKETKWKQWRIIRDWQDQVITLELRPFGKGQPEGWMANLLS